MQRFALVTILLAALAADDLGAAAAPSADGGARRSVTILYTINNQGYLDPCG